MPKLRRILLASLVVAIGSMLFVAAPAAAHHGPHIDGTYRYHDLIDRSNLTVVVSGGNDYLYQYDDAGSICVDHGYGFVPAFHGGHMKEVGPSQWDVTGAVWCQTRSGWRVVSKSLTITYEAHNGHDYLTDNTGQPYKFDPS